MKEIIVFEFIELQELLNFINNNFKQWNDDKDNVDDDFLYWKDNLNENQILDLIDEINSFVATNISSPFYQNVFGFVKKLQGDPNDIQVYIMEYRIPTVNLIQKAKLAQKQSD